MTDHALLESLLFEPTRGYFLLHEHLQRLACSGDYFGYPIHLDHIAASLLDHGRELRSPTKVRLLVHRDGSSTLENAPVKPSRDIRLALATTPVDSQDPFLRHKTTERRVYDQAKAEHPDADDVLLHNERAEVTETTAGNIVLELDGQKLTPHLSAGLLPGTHRRHLLARGQLREARLTLADVQAATGIWMINSVRRWCRAVLQAPADSTGSSHAATAPDTGTQPPDKEPHT